MCGCKLGTVKRKNVKQKIVEITTEDVLFAAAGVGAAMMLNPLANKAIADQSDNVKKTVATALPAAKLIGGGYLAMQKQVDRRARFFGIGVGMEGTVELVLRYAPEEYVGIKINGVDGDLFNYLGNSSVIEIPVNPGASGNLSAGSGTDAGFVSEAILGTALYEEMEMQEVI